MGFDIILEIIELRPLAVAIAHAILLDSDFLEQGRRLLAGWRAEDPVVIAEMNDIAFLTVRRWQAIAHLVEDAISDGGFLSHERRGFQLIQRTAVSTDTLSHERRGFQPGYDVCFPLTAKKGTVFVLQRLFCAILTTYVILTNLG